jgi:hypothetical protein
MDNLPEKSLTTLILIFLIKFLRKFGKVSEDSLWSSQGQYPFERSMRGGSLENEFEVFRVYFLGTKSLSSLFNGIYK